RCTLPISHASQAAPQFGHFEQLPRMAQNSLEPAVSKRNHGCCSLDGLPSLGLRWMERTLYSQFPGMAFVLRPPPVGQRSGARVGLGCAKAVPPATELRNPLL